MFKENDIITVEGRSMRGRNRIREHGNKWRVNRSDGEMLLIEPKGATDLRQLRWIHLFQDPHFKVISE